MSTSVSRNDPCPCGSGKKYKKCCLPRDQEALAVRAVPKAPSPKTDPVVCDHAHWHDYGFVEDDLDKLSNSIVDLIRNRDLDEAEKRCHELRERYPDVIDWMMRLAAVFEARGLPKQAAGYYRKAADFAEKAGGHDFELIDDFRRQAERLETSST